MMKTNKGRRWKMEKVVGGGMYEAIFWRGEAPDADIGVTSLVTSSAGWKKCYFGSFFGPKTKINWIL